jgi:hypothetical protein
MQRLEVSGAVRRIYMSLRGKGYNFSEIGTDYFYYTIHTTKTKKLNVKSTFRSGVHPHCKIYK